MYASITIDNHMSPYVDRAGPPGDPLCPEPLQELAGVEDADGHLKITIEYITSNKT